MCAEKAEIYLILGVPSGRTLLSPSRARAGQHDVPGALLTPSPCRYAYIEFEEKSSVKAAVELDESLFRGRVIKVGAG